MKLEERIYKGGYKMLNTQLTKILKIFSNRILETREEALKTIIIKERCVINYIGEHSKSLEDELQALFHYIYLFCRGYSISIKPSQFRSTWWIDEITNIENKPPRPMLWIDAEEYCESKKQLEIAVQLKKFCDVGLCIQLKSPSFLEDVAKCIDNNIHIRLCKGAYKPKRGINRKELLTNAELAIEICEEADKFYLLEIATIKDYDLVLLAMKYGLVLQLLYGWDGEFKDYPYGTRIYIPFGTHWMPYILRRLRGA